MVALSLAATVVFPTHQLNCHDGFESHLGAETVLGACGLDSLRGRVAPFALQASLPGLQRLCSLFVFL